jgi:triphosphoribosyl-dephospho-CoA synthase
MAVQGAQSTGSAGRIARAFVDACEAELAACKPGNVHIHAGGHRMSVDDFRSSARVAAPHLAREGAGIGVRVLGAVDATLEATGQNTNLGIILLCAPLAAAGERGAPPISRSVLRQALVASLDALTDADARDVFAAIAQANPGGLGERGDHDVRASPTIALREAMKLAAGEDRVAAAYVDGFEDVFGLGLAVLDSARRSLAEAPWQVAALYLAFLSSFPDSHIARKFGAETAVEVQREARIITADFYGAPPEDRLSLLMAYDKNLKQRGLNPGTSADFTVATLFADMICAA